MKHPVFIVTGTSGAGKTTVIPYLRKKLKGYVVYDGDSVQGNDYNTIKCNWLRIAKSNIESNIKTVICSTIVPENLTECDHLQYFSNIYYINLEITDEQVQKRLQNRGWNQDLIDNYKQFNQWLKENKNKAFQPPMYAIDASNKDMEEIADIVSIYIQSIKK